MLDFNRFEYFTFDCYGTLIDWETGILEALRPILAAHSRHLPDEEVLSLYAELEAETERGSFRRYRQVLEEVVYGFGEKLRFVPTRDQVASLPDSLQSWKPFPDTVAALHKLAEQYKLAVISNVDDDLFAKSARLFEVPFAHVITSQQVRSYKPSLNNFQIALERIETPPHKVLHVAQSVFHDIVPAKKLGIATVWVNRRLGKQGTGATQFAVATPDLEVQDLASLAQMAVTDG